MSTVQQLLNALKKIFYDLTPVSNKQMSLMPMANGGIGFCKYEAKNLWTITQFCTAGISHGGNLVPRVSLLCLPWSLDQNKIVVTSQISTRLRRSRQQVSNPVSSIIHGLA